MSRSAAAAMRGADRGVGGFDQRRLSHAARAPQQRIVRRQAAREPFGIFDQEIAHPVDALEQRHLDTVDVAHRREPPAFGVPDECLGRGKIRHRTARAARRRSSASAIRCRTARGRRPRERWLLASSGALIGRFFCPRRGDLAMFAPGCAYPPSGLRMPSLARPEASRNIAIRPTAAIVRADFPRKIGPYPQGRRVA